MVSSDMKPDDALPVTAIAAPTCTAFRNMCIVYGLSPRSTIWLHDGASADELRGLRAVRLIWGSTPAVLSPRMVAKVQENLCVIRLIGQVTEEGGALLSCD